MRKKIKKKYRRSDKKQIWISLALYNKLDEYAKQQNIKKEILYNNAVRFFLNSKRAGFTPHKTTLDESYKK